jgi:hypothetical protein
MLKLRNVLVAVGLSMSIVLPAFPQGNQANQGNMGCRNGTFPGSYTHLVTYTDIWGDGTNVLVQTIRQLTLHMDGTAIEEDTSAPEILLSSGTISPRVGSWKCRSDGKLVVTLIWAGYTPTTDAKNHPSSVPNPPPVDLALTNHYRVSYLFSVTNLNTLTRTEARTRQYTSTEDPTDLAGGVLIPLNTSVFVYNRVVASDADLLAP